MINHGKKLGKAVYVISADNDAGKVVHGNHVPAALKAKLDARTWASNVAEVLGGKAGGKEDGAQGVGSDITKVEEALKVATDYYQTATLA